MSERKFDPSKAEVGPFARNQYVESHRPAGNANLRGGNFASSSSSSGGGDESGYSSVISPESEEEEELTKEATIPEPGNAEMPSSIKPGDLDKVRSTIEDVDPDLNPGGVDRMPDPSTRDMIRARLENMTLEFKDSEKDFLEREVDRQNDRRETHKSMPTDIEIERDNLSETMSGGGFNDGRVSKLSSGSQFHTLLANPESNPVRLMLVLDNEWGEEWYDWEIETINQTAEMDNAEIHRVNEDKIMAIKILKNTDEFFDEPRVFEKVCTAFSGRQVDWGHVQEPRTHEICACIALINRYVKEEPFSDDVKAYVAAAALRDGYILLPSTIKFASGPFSKELVSKIGDDAIEKQRKLNQALEEEDPDIFDSEDAVQYMRLIKCQYHAQEKVDEVRG